MTKSPLLIGLFALGFCITSCDEPADRDTETTDASEMEAGETTDETAVSGDFSVDVSKSVVEWEGTMVGVYDHTGIVDFKDGKLQMDNGQITQATFVVDMTSLQATDDNFDPEEGNTKEKLISHLESDDFFLVEEYPTATFNLQQIDGQTATGTMTIRGNENPVEVENLDIHVHDNELHITGNTTFDRTKFGVEFSHPAEEMVVSDDVDLNIDITATKN